MVVDDFFQQSLRRLQHVMKGPMIPTLSVCNAASEEEYLTLSATAVAQTQERDDKELQRQRQEMEKLRLDHAEGPMKRRT